VVHVLLVVGRGKALQIKSEPRAYFKHGKVKQAPIIQ